MPDKAVDSISDSCDDPVLLNCLPKDLMKNPVNPQLPMFVYKTKLEKDWVPGGYQDTGKNTRKLAKDDTVIVKFDCSEEKRTFKEYAILSQIKHCNVVTVFQYYDRDVRDKPPGTQGIYPFFVMEEGECSLSDFLFEKFGKKYPTAYFEEDVNSYNPDDHSMKYTARRCLNWLQQIAEGMDFLHSKKILHRDLKPANVLLFDGCTTCKVCDLDLGKEDRGSSKRSENVGTPNYIAPEVSTGKYSYPADCYSFGVLMADCLSRRSPKNRNCEIPEKSAFGDAEDAKYEFKKLRNCMMQLTDADPKKRPTFSIAKSIIEVCLSKDETQLPELDLQDRNDGQAQAADEDPGNNSYAAQSRRTPSKLRSGRTVFYAATRLVGSVADGANSAAQSGVRIPKELITTLFKGDSRKINTLAALQGNRPEDKSKYATVMHDFSVHEPIEENQLFIVEHVIRNNEPHPESEVHNYCFSREEHLKWLTGRLQYEPCDYSLDNLVFTVQKITNLARVVPN